MMKQQKSKQSTISTLDTIPVSDSIKKKFFVRLILFILYHLIRIAMTMAIIIYIVQTDVQKFFNTQTYARMQEISLLWEKEVIVDIKTISSYNCPQGYQSFTASIWPGTMEGCYCSVDFQVYDYFHIIPAQCTGKLIGAGCNTIQPVQQIPFIFWQADQLICIKRITNLTFSANLSKIEQTKICAQGKDYEISSLDSLDCPITDLKNDSTLSYQLPDIGFSFQNQTQYPIIDLKITEYDFCLDYDQSNISPNRFQNYVLQLREKQHCEGSDPRVLQVDQKTQSQLFLSNKRVYDTVMDLPGFPQPSDDYIYKLGIVRYPPWSYQCRTKSNMTINIAKKNFMLIEQSYNSQVTIAITIILTVFVGFIYSLSCLIYNFLDLSRKRKNGTFYLTDDQIQRIDPSLLTDIFQISLTGQLVLIICLLSLQIILAVVVGKQYEAINQLEQWFRQSIFCVGSSQYFENYLTQYIKFFQQMIRTFLICILVSVIMIAVDILYFVWRLHKGDLSSQNLADLLKSQQIMSQKNSDEQKFNEKQSLQQKKMDLKLQQITQNQQMDIGKRKQTQQSQINLTENCDLSQLEELRISYPKSKKKKKIRMSDIQFD